MSSYQFFQIIRITQAGKEIGYVSSSYTADESIRISYSAWPEAEFIRRVASMIVRRKGFDDLEFNYEPVMVYSSPTHL